MKFSKLLLLTFLIFSAHYERTIAQTVSVSPAPAVWAWQVQGDGRKVYLLGELHGFVSTNDLKIDYQLGNDIYQLSSEVWTEAIQTSSQNQQKISEKIPKDLWQNVDKSVKKIVYKISRRTSAEKEDLYKQYVKEVDANDPYAAYGNLLTLAELNAQFKNPFLKVYGGMSKVLISIDEKNPNKKIRLLESSTSVADMWKKNCTNEEDLTTFISAAVGNLEESLLFDKSLNSKSQDTFLNPTSKLSEFTTLILNEPAGEIINRCVVVTRNKLWLPKILELLRTSGPPVTLLMGIAHVSGDEGVLALVKSAGYTDVRRIYSVK
jgi:uncharacterized protein YbaP (TraB family)